MIIFKTMGAASRRAKRIRKAAEFDVSKRLSRELRQPRDGRNTINAWSLENIFAAREAQMLGHFVLPARMAEQMRTDDALAVAYENRLAPQRCLPVEIVPAKGARGVSIAGEADALFGPKGVGIRPDTLADIHGCLVNHEVAFANVVATPREDGTRVDFELHYWPIEYVRWDPLYRTFFTRVDLTSDVPAADRALDPGIAGSPAIVSGFDVPIVHGDGRWVIFQRYEVDPFRHGALLSAAIVWARHAFACRDWSKGSVAHGNAKVVGELPEGMALQDEDGLTPQAAAFLELLQAIGNGDAPVGIRPAGSKTDFLTNSSTAWQVWQQLVDNAEKAAARIYLGTDGTLGSQGGAPGIDITALFGVASTKVRGDLECIERGINTGVIEPWCAVNFGDSSLAPQRKYKVPDEDKDAIAESHAKRNQAFFADVESAKRNGFLVDQAYVDALAVKHGVEAPVLKPVVLNPPAAPAPAGQ